MFAAGAFGASWLWLLALVVARYYGTWGREWWGWQELSLDGRALHRLVTRHSYSASRIEVVAIMGMLVYAAGLAGFVLHAEIS